MRVAEMFRSRQGEGKWTGTESLFVRLAGCPLRCRYCDTPYAQDARTAPEMSVAEIIAAVEERDIDAAHVVITGGEPLISDAVLQLIDAFRKRDSKHGSIITVETSGHFFQPVSVDLLSLSPKLGNADHGILRDTLQRLTECSPSYQFKFVVDVLDDIHEVLEFLDATPFISRDAVYLMPQATDAETMLAKEAWLHPQCETLRLRYAPRMQLVWYGNRPMT